MYFLHSLAVHDSLNNEERGNIFFYLKAAYENKKICLLIKQQK